MAKTDKNASLVSKDTQSVKQPTGGVKKPLAGYAQLLNKKLKNDIFADLSSLANDSNVKGWISTDSEPFNMILSNRRDGGIPVGRITEISGPESCVTDDTFIRILIGTEYIVLQIREIESLLKEGKKVKVESLNGEYVDILQFINKGLLDTYLVTLDNGYTIKVTATHRFFTDSGWLETKFLIQDTTSILCDDNIYHVVKSIEYIGKHNIVDISVNHPDECYFGNGMLNHNTAKSGLAYHICKNAQKKGGIVIYFDTEGAFSPEMATRIGVDMSPEKFVFTDTITVEQIFETIEELVTSFGNSDQLFVVVWDSIAQSVTNGMLEGDYDSEMPAQLARVIGKCLSKNLMAIRNSNIAFIFINQERDKFNAQKFGEQSSTPGGRILKFAASIRIKVSKVSTLKKDKDAQISYGIRIKAETKKNKVAIPFRSAQYDFQFARGIVDHEYVWEQIGIYGESSTFRKGGNTVYTTDETIGEELKFDKSSFLNKMDSSPAFRKKMYDGLAEHLIVDMKYVSTEVSESVEEPIIGDDE